MKCYSELILLPTFEERFKYLEIKGTVGDQTFGPDRYLNQLFYHSQEWKRLRDAIILRDLGCDLGVVGYEIQDKIIIHHMNPIEVHDIINQTELLLNPEFLICVSSKTHNGIHFGYEYLKTSGLVERKPNDTCPWKH